MRQIIKISAEVKDFFTRHATIVDTFGDDGKTERRRYFHLPFWFMMEEYKIDQFEVFGLDSELPHDLVETLNFFKGEKAVTDESIEEVRQRSYFPEFGGRPNPNWTDYQILKYLNRYQDLNGSK